MSSYSHIPKVLFILKYRENAWEYPDLDVVANEPPTQLLSSGLYNSARFVAEMLEKKGVQTKLVHVPDNNCIDREVHSYKPTHVIIEAYWVVPEKFEVLQSLHPEVKWIIRNHSEIPFLANEGIAMDWSLRYVKYQNVYLSCNSKRSTRDMRTLIAAAHSDWSNETVNTNCIYLPNYYNMDENTKAREYRGTREIEEQILHICCFGAIRPLKNHLIQAIAAIRFANANNKTLHFHINFSRLEGNGSPVLKNLRQLFEQMNGKHSLIEHSWLNHSDFLMLIAKMDISLQVSFTETFNIVSADCISVGVPTIVSKEISWMPTTSMADPTNTEDIYEKMFYSITDSERLIQKGREGLLSYLYESEKVWLDFFAVLAL